jgi:hypothetical protein
MSVPASDPSPDFGKDTVSVHFTIAENFFLGRNTETCTRRAFGLWRSVSYEPANVFYLPDDSGKMVEVVSLIKWSGVLFPWPEFGGVQIIEQGDTNLLGRVAFGCGRWIPPEKVKQHPFLVGQNIVPHAVSRFRAGSLRFQGGTNFFERFFAPMWFNRQGDIVVADVPEDMNPQPFVLFFKMNSADPGKLYQYFSLETRDLETHGISASFWYPADGIGPSYVYRYASRGERLIGVTALRDRVMASRRNYNWGSNMVGEARPYIHRIADDAGTVEIRFLYMVTLVTFTQVKGTEGSEARFTVGGNPEIAMIDANREKVVWVDTYHPEKWDEQIRSELGTMWAHK